MKPSSGRPIRSRKGVPVKAHPSKPPAVKQVKPGRGGTKDAVSRYVQLKKRLDDDKVSNGNWVLVDTARVSDKAADIVFADLFSGAGGISVGARQAGLCKLFGVEIDRDASDTTRQNFPEAIHFEMPIEDLSKAALSKAIGKKKVDVVFGGPPCQGFSVAGLRNPKDPRNRLFKEYIRVVKLLKPSFVVMENVPGILTMDGGKVYKEIIRQFKAAGYPNMTVRILEAATFGVPQLRARAFFIANRLGVANPYPAETHKKEKYEKIEDHISDLAKYSWGGFPNHQWTRHSKEFEKRISKVPPGGSMYETFRDAYKRQYLGVPSMAVKENHGGCHIHPVLNRVLSAREMARLQTFPDDFIFSGTFKRAYWQIGNAVPCLMAKHIALAIKKTLRAKKKA